MQIWTVPCGASNVKITTFGAQGAAGSTNTPSQCSGGLAGFGNKVIMNVPSLVPTNQLFIYVGGQAVVNVGGFNGGGNGVTSATNLPSGGGGGATDVRFPADALADRIQVAGGGGGNSSIHGNGSAFTGGNGGNGGGNQTLYGNSFSGGIGSDAFEAGLNVTIIGAGGATESNAGLAGPGCNSFLGQNGSLYSNNVGGNGGAGNNGFGTAGTIMRPSGGAGGGGYVGGNGGGGGSAGTSGCQGNVFGAGGGGSAGTNFATGTFLDTNGVHAGNGMVIIEYFVALETASVSPITTLPCVGQSVVLNATPSGGVFSTNLPGTIVGNSFTPTTAGNYDVVYTIITCGVSKADTISAFINPIATASLTSFVNPCVGQSVNLLASPAGGIFSNNVSGTIVGANFSPTTETTYEIIYTTSSCGVQISDTVTAIINCDLAGIDELASEQTIFPNPARDFITIKNISGSYDYQIVNTFGQTLLFGSSVVSESLSVDDLSHGVYFLNIHQNGKKTVLKFLKD